MTILVVGASGATGTLLVGQLLSMGHNVKAIVRSSARIPASWNRKENLSILTAQISEMTAVDLTACVKDCDAVASCLGHTLSLNGIYGKPRRLVADAVRRLCETVIAVSPEKPVTFVLMNTAGVVNRTVGEHISAGQKIMLAAIRLLIPPHADNEAAADYLQTRIGRDNRHIEWVIVRPDTLIDRDTVDRYGVHPSPTRSALFDPGKTGRLHVAHFMARLITDDGLWNTWKGCMPVIYDAAEETGARQENVGQ